MSVKSLKLYIEVERRNCIAGLGFDRLKSENGVLILNSLLCLNVLTFV